VRFAGALQPVSTLIVNDRVDVAGATCAAGVHLPASGLPVAAARSMLGSSALVGRSTHTSAEALAAEAEGADYVFLGPIWETPSHPGSAGLGIAAITAARGARVIAIGGVTPERVAPCLDAGAWGVAAISALWLANDVAAAADAFLLSLSG
jgi:thiamine-phosphate pyrophosphorylase